jgi:NADPH:quinone reductase-like Zn-dependent oxidoreductase
VAVGPETVGHKPPSVTHEDAAATATVGCTALQSLRDKGRLKAGQRVLVNGASGGVGSHAVQIATELGAQVWGTTSAAKADFVRSLGAARVIDYNETPPGSVDGKFDVVLDAASKSSFQAVRRLLNRGGSYVTLLPSPGFLGGMFLSAFSSKRCGVVVVKSRTDDLDQLGRWLGEGKLEASVEKTFALSDITTALAAFEAGGARGKLAVHIKD